jgi:cytochrome P450
MLQTDVARPKIASRTFGERRPPGPSELSMIQNTVAMLREPLGHLLRGHAEYGDVAQFRLGPQRYWLVSDIDAVRRVLVENAKAYKKSPNYVGLRLVLGEGLVTSEGELHKRQRRLASPAFQHRRIDAFVPTFARHTERMLDQWHARGERGIDAHKEMMALTLRIVGDCLFDTNLDGATERFGAAVETVLHFANEYALSLVKLPLWLPTPRRRGFNQALAVLDDAVAELLRERKSRIARGGEAGADLLGAFLTARDDDGSAMSDRQLRDEVLTMLAAGHETTANTMSFTLHLLSRHPATERAVMEEVTRVLGDAPLTLEHLPQLELTERVIKESMRLLPPVWMMERENIEDDVLGGYTAKAGTVIGISPWVLHRDARIWPNPEGFDPDRWLPEIEKTRPRYAYLPFGAGPRVCIGAGFAMTEAKVLLALIVRRAKLSLVPGHELKLDPNVTLRPQGPLPMALTMRG